MRLHYSSYFSVYALQRFYLPSPVHSNYINVEVLQRYLPVGGVRIEDDLLITPTGFENLTTAPKGDAMLEIIRKGSSNDLLFTARRQPSRSVNSKEQPALLRAPGISTDRPESILKPIARAATMPAEFKQRKSVDFEPCDGPSLFSNFKRSLTTDESIQQWQQDRDLAATSRDQSDARSQCATVCGDISKGVKHVYLVSDFHRPTTRYQSSFEHPLPPCKKCTILCETLDRLRQNLSLSEQNLPRPEAQTHSVSVETRTKQSSRGSASAQRQEVSARANMIRGLQRSPEPTSRTDNETVPMLHHVPGNRQSSLRPHRSVPGLGAQGLEGGLAYNRADQMRSSQGAARTRTNGRPAHMSLPDESEPEDKFSVAKAAAAKEQLARHKRCHLSRRPADQLENEARQAFESASRSSPSSDQVARGRQTLYDLMVQRQNNPSLKGERCGLGTEQRNESLISTAIEKTQAENTRPLPESPNHIRGCIEDLDAQLTTYMQSFRVTDPPLQLGAARRTEK
jgi:hypothetical protein